MGTAFCRIEIPILFALLFTATGSASDPQQGETRHWSFRPRSRPQVASFDDPVDRAWVRSPIDAFILNRLKEAGLKPAQEADRRTLIRRLTFDLIGLPPHPDEITAFENDASRSAYERLVDRLLASPAYGERWGRHWLDVVRFAETEGFEYDRERPGAWRFRDYVIQVFNRDLPFDKFVLAQLAGDEIGPNDPEMQIAAGFHRLGPVRRNAGNQEVAASRNEILTDRTDILGAAFLGLTVGCARCHDHKFDDIPQADYYRLQAFLAATQDRDILTADAATQAAWKTLNEPLQREIRQLTKQLTKATGEEEKRLMEQLEEVQRRLPAPLPAVSSVANVEKERTPIHVLKRGDWNSKGEQVSPRALSALLAETAPELPAELSNPRTVLARWLIEPRNPLTARVLVNRVWQHHFGRGLVNTPNDFGTNGEPPSHPALLDYLANSFVESGWQLKPLHRLIVLSSSYRQAPQPADLKLVEQKDPADRLLSHFPRRRLSAEEIRDSMLVIGGTMYRKAGGPSVLPPVDRDLVNLLYDPKQWLVTPEAKEHQRRSIYLIAKRNLRLPFMEVFDQPDVQTSCACRQSSTHAPQALELLNGATANQAARDLARRLRLEAGSDHARQIELGFWLAIGRLPSPREQALAADFLTRRPLEEFALAVFSLNVFLYVD